MQTKEIRAICLRLLARREYSQLELLTKLSLKGFIRQDVQAVINILANQGLQSDERFAEIYARSRFNKGFGSLKVAYELKQRGIDDFDLQAVIMENFGDETQLINHVYNKKYVPTSKIPLKERLKRQRFLQQRGFSKNLIHVLF
jgi:regulatory protein